MGEGEANLWERRRHLSRAAPSNTFIWGVLVGARQRFMGFMLIVMQNFHKRT